MDSILHHSFGETDFGGSGFYIDYTFNTSAVNNAAHGTSPSVGVLNMPQCKSFEHACIYFYHIDSVYQNWYNNEAAQHQIQWIPDEPTDYRIIRKEDLPYAFALRASYVSNAGGPTFTLDFASGQGASLSATIYAGITTIVVDPGSVWTYDIQPASFKFQLFIVGN